MLNCKCLMMSVLAVPTALLGQDPAAPSAQASAAVSKQVIERWIADLDSDNFDTRQAATRKLEEAGGQVIKQITEAATGDSLEVTSRSIDVLSKLMKSKDQATADAAKAALKELAKSSHKSASRRADKALEPPADPNQNAAGVIVGNGGIQIQIQPGQIQGARIIKLKQQNANGEKSIEVDDNGRKVKIKESKKDGIQIEVTETDKNGKAETKTYKAKDAEELKKKHPEAHKLYEKYGKGGAAAVIGNIQIQAQALPAGLPARMRRLMPQTPQERKALEQMKEAQKQLDDAIERLKKLGEDNGIEEIEKITKQMEEVKQQIETSRGAFDRTRAAEAEDAAKPATN